MEIKLAFFDIDGTLLPFEQNEIPESTRRSLLKLQENGVKIFVATGKSLAQLSATKAMEIPFDGYLTLNGQLCYDKDFKMCFGCPIDPREMEIMEKAFDSKTIPYTLVGEFSRYINYVDDIVVFRQRETNSTVPSVDKYKGEKIYQITAYVTPKQKEILENVLDMCMVTAWAPDAIDIIAKDGGKLNAMNRIIELNGATPEETIAFGDAENDILMVSHAGIGIAMGNACDELKSVADFITDDVDKDGVEKALKMLRLI